MSDRLYFSIWTRNPSPLTMHDRFATMLGAFPFSKFSPNLLLTVRAVSAAEAPLLEQSFDGPGALDDLRAALETWRSPDASFEIEAAWDLLQPQVGEWKLGPSRVLLLAFGPGFERDGDDDLRIEFGRENLFIPEAESPLHFKMAGSNIRSLLKLVHDMETALPVAKRLLWSESGENFAARLAQIAGGA